MTRIGVASLCKLCPSRCHEVTHCPVFLRHQRGISIDRVEQIVELVPMASSELRPAEVEPNLSVGHTADVGEKVLEDPTIAIVVFIGVT